MHSVLPSSPRTCVFARVQPLFRGNVTVESATPKSTGSRSHRGSRYSHRSAAISPSARRYDTAVRHGGATRWGDTVGALPIRRCGRIAGQKPPWWFSSRRAKIRVFPPEYPRKSAFPRRARPPAAALARNAAPLPEERSNIGRDPSPLLSSGASRAGGSCRVEWIVAERDKGGLVCEHDVHSRGLEDRQFVRREGDR